jgi:hypothetical protein
LLRFSAPFLAIGLRLGLHVTDTGFAAQDTSTEAVPARTMAPPEAIEKALQQWNLSR